MADSQCSKHTVRLKPANRKNTHEKGVHIHRSSTNTVPSQLSYPASIERRRSTAVQSFLERRRLFKVTVDGLDGTPNYITHPDFASMDESCRHAAYETSNRIMEDFLFKRAKSKSRVMTTDIMTTKFTTTINLDDICIDHTVNTEEGLADNANFDLKSSYFLQKMNPISTYPLETVITLTETKTAVLFELPSLTHYRETPEGEATAKANEYYQYITVGKGKNRRMINEETQTINHIAQSRYSQASRPVTKNAGTFASTWDMHDTYAYLKRNVETVEDDEMVLYQSASPSMLRHDRRNSKNNHDSYKDITSSSAFLDAVLLTERVLSSKEYNDAQKKYRGLVKLDPLSLDLVYIYSMKPLWTFECEEILDKPITNISFNPKNADILAACHGKFEYAEDCEGMICVWCTKNPRKPERLYRFKNPLTSVCFSDKNPNWLACGFWNGDVIIIDITSYSIKTIATSNRKTNPCFEAIWGVQWRAIDKEFEYVMTICEDGRINRFTSTKTHEFLCAPMMRVCTVEGKMKGLETAKESLKTDVPITRYPAALCMKWHPRISHIYWVGTSEGCVHRCSTNYLNQHIDVFRVHAGPVYDIMICPFHDQLLVTCGADNAIRLWMEGIDDMILTMMCPAAVYGVAFCPKNATILVSVSGNLLLVWDLRRKTHVPCAEYAFPSNVTLTYVHFAESGDNVFIGDTLGRIHTFHLEDTPIPPYYQRVMLDEVIKKALCTRPQLLKQLDKLDRVRERAHKIS